jgi:tetratricopeptide (TPR) repeat protein
MNAQACFAVLQIALLCLSLAPAAADNERMPTDAELRAYYSRYSNVIQGRPEYIQCMKDATALMARFRFQESIAACEKALTFKPADHLARALLCLNCYEIGEMLDVKIASDRNRKNRLYDRMIDVSSAGIGFAPDKGECYFMRGLARARKATTKGILYSLYSAKMIENDWLKAVSSRSMFVTARNENLLASSCLSLGIYYRVCPTDPVLKFLFGISGDFDKSIRYMAMAHEMDPESIEITKELGISYVTRGLALGSQADIEKGKACLRAVPALPKKLKTDGIDIEHSRVLLKDISLCPGYSRDQQQDLSEKEMRKAANRGK